MKEATIGGSIKLLQVVSFDRHKMFLSLKVRLIKQQKSNLFGSNTDFGLSKNVENEDNFLSCQDRHSAPRRHFQSTEIAFKHSRNLKIKLSQSQKITRAANFR